METTQVQVLPSGGKWKTSSGGEFSTQAEAIDAAREELQRSGGGELVIHGEDGAIRAKDTIGKDDPRNIPG